MWCEKALCVFADNLTQSGISFHFLDWMVGLCPPFAGDFSVVASTLHSVCDSPMRLYRVCQTHALEMWPPVCLHSNNLHGGVLRRCRNLPGVYPLSPLQCFSFTPDCQPLHLRGSTERILSHQPSRQECVVAEAPFSFVAPQQSSLLPPSGALVSRTRGNWAPVNPLHPAAHKAHRSVSSAWKQGCILPDGSEHK